MVTPAASASPESAALPPRIVLYDGVCGLCHHAVQFLIARDLDRKLHFAPLQGETAATLRARHPQIPASLDTMVYVEDDRVYLRSRAFVRISRHVRGPTRFLYKLRFIPSFLLDLGYRVIARIRYRIWGRHDTCQLPSVEERAQLLP